MLLLDTCTLIWLASAPEKLSEKARATIDAAPLLLLSDVSTWEICLKWQAKKIILPSPPRTWITEQTRLWHLQRTAIEAEQLFRAVELEEHHRDPFDRLLVAQALTLNAHVVTPDPSIHRYPVSVIW